MPFNGSGTFNLQSSYPYVTGTVISATNVNLLLQDIANGLSNAVCRDGQSVMAGPIHFQGYNVDGNPSLNFSVSNSVKGQLNSSGNWLFGTTTNGTGLVQIVGASGVSQLTVGTATNPNALNITTVDSGITQLAANTGTGFSLGTANSAPLNLVVDSVTQFSIAVGGNVTIPNGALTLSTGNLTLTAGNLTLSNSGATVTATNFAGLATNATNLVGTGTIATGVTAVTQASGDHTTKLATTAFVNPSSNIAANGHRTFPDGLIMNWGSFTYSSASGTVAFSGGNINFPTGPLMVTASNVNSAGGYIAVGTATTTGFSFGSALTSGTFYWIALGY